jgi:hypothetical protein
MSGFPSLVRFSPSPLAPLPEGEGNVEALARRLQEEARP